ncbi:MAG: NAD-dependent epimerase/dehydratase family protein [Planctomycetota bacterium]
MPKSSGKKTRVALVGGGYIAEYHLEPLRQLPWVELSAVVDPDLRRAKALAARWRIPEVHADLDGLLAGDRPDVAHVATPPPEHGPVAARLLDEGVAAFVEKPLGLSVAECEELHQLAQARGVPLGVNHSQVFHPGFRELMALVEARVIGPVEHVVSVTNLPLRQLAQRQIGHWMFREPRNILLEQGPHPFSLLLALLGEVRSARTMLSKARLLAGTVPFHESWQANLRCARGTASVYLRFGGHHLASSLELIGPDGTLSLDLARGFVQHVEKTQFPDFEDTRRNAVRNARRLKRTGRRAFWGYLGALLRFRPRNDLFFAAMRDSIHAFHQALREGRPVPQSAREAREVMRYCHLVWSGREPEFPPIAETTRSVPVQAGGDEVLVLGATGFIGSHLVERLVARGDRVRVLVRGHGPLPAWLNHPAVMVLHGDLEDEGQLERAVRGCRHVYHLATGLGQSWEECRRVGVGGTELLARKCLAAGVERLVFTSSIAALYLGESVGDAKAALDPHPVGRSLYARLKIACEQVLDRMHREDGLDVVVLRPAIVVGHRGRSRVSGTGYWPRDNHCIGWNKGDNPLPFVLVEDVVEALVAAARRPGLAGRHYDLVGPVRLTAREYVQEVARLSRRPVGFHPRTPAVLQLVEIGKWLVKLAIRKPDNRFPSYRDLKTRGLVAWLDASTAEEDLGWRPERDRVRFIDKGIRVVLEEDG